MGAWRCGMRTPHVIAQPHAHNRTNFVHRIKILMSSQSEDFFSRESNPEFYGLELMLITAPPRTHVLSLDKCVRGGAVNNNKVLMDASVAERLFITALDSGIPSSIPGR